MAKTLTLAPVTRIEGHLDIEVTIDAVGGASQVVDARVSGTMFRGFELLLKGQHPRDAISLTQRICGICPASHGMAAAMALESAYAGRAAPPDNGRILRNLLLGVDFLQSHLTHFYQLALLDYVDVSHTGKISPLQSQKPSADMISGDEAAALVGHYAQAIDIRRKLHQMGAILGGKMPCSPLFTVGGANATLSNNVPAGDLKGSQKIEYCGTMLDEVRGFILSTWLPDLELLSERFPAYFKIGKGCGRLMSFGAFDLDATGEKRLFTAGLHSDGAKAAFDAAKIGESSKYSRYSGAQGSVHPAKALAAQPEPNKPGAYSRIKAPRYAGDAFEVGPLARMVIAGRYDRGISVMDRLTARALEAQYLGDAMKGWLKELKLEGPTRATVKHPSAGVGMGLSEAPRGAVGHWIAFSNKGIDRYQVLSPTSWNASPMDGEDQKGPMEQALIGTPVADQANLIEVLRVIHSFDPCLACSVH